MPGKVIAVMVQPGSTVTRGTPLLVMEAMKMEHTISAPADGVVSEVLYGVGEQVAEGATAGVRGGGDNNCLDGSRAKMPHNTPKKNWSRDEVAVVRAGWPL